MSVRLSFDEARRRAMFRELESDPTIVLIGGDPARQRSPEYDSRFADRMLTPPLSEFSYSSVAVGAAMSGLRPFVSVHTSSFIFYAWSALVEEAANVRYLSGGRSSAPVVFSLIAGSRKGGGPQHQHTPQAMLQNVPGLRVFAPGTPAELDAAIHEALTGDDPTVLIEHTFLDGEGEVPDEPEDLPAAEVIRAGTDLAIVGYSYTSLLSMTAASALEQEGVLATVVSVPVLSPSPADVLGDLLMDYEAVVFVDESRAPGSPASHWMASLAERRSVRSLRMRLVCSMDVPDPAAAYLCEEVGPTTGRVLNAALALLERSSS